MTITRRDAVDAITAAIEAGDAHAGDYDLGGIADRLYDLLGTWDVEQADPETFWATAVGQRRCRGWRSVVEAHATGVPVEDMLIDVGREWTAIRAAERTIAKRVHAAIAAAATAGVPETRIAELVGCDRMTVRRVLGKR